MASNELRTQSGEAQKPPKVDSVFDFLYADTRRIASFLSQFTSFGHLTEIVHGEQSSEGTDRAGSLKADASVAIATLGGEHATTTSTEHGESSQKRYDPTWTNALNFLNYLAELDLLNRDVTKAAIGSFVLYTGRMRIHDLKMLERMWGLPSVEKAIRSGVTTSIKNRQERRRAAATGVDTKPPSEIDMLLDMLTVLPHSIQASFGDGHSYSTNVWCTLLGDGLSTSTSDLMLKHGGTIPGDWSVVGILDARAVRLSLTPPPPPPSPDFTSGTELGTKLLDTLAPITKTMLGRPDHAYGVTPLLVFREIGKPGPS